MSAEIAGVSLAVAGTVLSIYNMVLFNRQSKLMEKQALWQRSEVYPYVRVEKIEFKVNTLSLNLKNMSETPAFEIGLLVNFYAGSKLENDGFLTFADPIEFNDADPYFKKAYAKQTVNPLRNEEGSNRLYAKENGVFRAEPSFIFANSQKNLASSKIGYTWEPNNYPLLRARLLGQNIRYVAVTLKLVYKDPAETLQEFEQFGQFIVDLKKHETFEQAAKEKIPYKQSSIDIKGRPMEFETYKMKGFRSRLEPFP
jgi:hypothetical protein